MTEKRILSIRHFLTGGVLHPRRRLLPCETPTTHPQHPPFQHLDPAREGGLYRIGKWPIKRHLRTIRPQSRGVKKVVLNGCQAETAVELPFAADCCPWVGKLRTVLPLKNRDVIRDSAVQLGLTHQRGANGVDSSAWCKWC
jgi:hypothetical protein